MTWPIVRVGDVAEQIRGVTFGKADTVASPGRGLIPVMTATNVTERGLVVESTLYLPEEKASTRQRLREGDVIVTTSSGSLSVVGRAVRVESALHATFGAFCKVLRPSSAVDQRFFAHFFRTSEYRATVARLAAGANINNLRNEDLDNLSLPLPPLSEQRRIASILDAIDSRRRDRLRTLELLTGLSATLVLDGTRRDRPVYALGEIAEVQGGLTVSASRVRHERQVGYLRVANVGRGRVDTKDLKLLGVTDDEVARVSLRAEDLLLVEGHGNPDEVGRAARWRGSSEPVVHQNHLIRVRANESFVEPRFLEAYINGPQGRRYFRSAARTTSGLNTINLTSVRNMPIDLPSLEIQGEIASDLSAIEHHVRKVRSHLARFDELFYSVQRCAFGGAL